MFENDSLKLKKMKNHGYVELYLIYLEFRNIFCIS